MDDANPGTSCPTLALKRPLTVLFLACLLPCPLAAEQSWEQALRTMTLGANPPLLNRENCVRVLLNAFQSNQVVKALVILPGVLDDFYLINRDKPKLNISAQNLSEAVMALTNATELRATFRPPFLLLHLDRDLIEPELEVRHEKASARLRRDHHLEHALYRDRHWETIQPELKGRLRTAILPSAKSEDAWHFNRHNLAGWNLSDWEWLSALSLAGRTSLNVQERRIVFQVNTNVPRLPRP